MTRLYRLLLATGLACAAASILAPSVARAQTYDFADDFSFTSATGIWTYAIAANLGDPITVLDTPFTEGSARGWRSSSINSLGTPTIYRNDSGGVPGTAILHPGPDGSVGDFAVVRFTTPSTTTYSLSAQFFAGDSGNTDAYILLNSSTTPLFTAASTSSNPLYTTSITLNAGDTLDFYVGTGGDSYFFDTTPAEITLTAAGSAVAPEPGTLALLVLPGLGLVARRRRK